MSSSSPNATRLATGSPSPLRRLVGLLSPDRGDIAAVVVFAVAIGGLLLATPIAVQALVNFVAFGGATTPILVLSVLLGVGLSFAAILTAFQTWSVEVLQRRLFVRTVGELVRRIPRLDPADRENRYAPELVNRFFDVVTIQKTTAFLLLDGLGVVLGVGIGMLVLAFYHPILLAFDLIIIAAVVVIVLGLGRSGIDTAVAESRAKYRVAGWLEEMARNPLTFRAGGAYPYLVERTDVLAREYIESRKAHYRVLFRQILGTLALQVAASVALLGLGGLLVVRGELTLGQLVAAELIVTYVVGTVAKIGKHLEAFYDLMGATDKLGLLLDVPLEPQGGEHWSGRDRNPGSTVELRDVSLDRRTGQADVREFSLQIGAGERVALLGTGEGPSTVLELIHGLRRPAVGSLEIDGLDLRQVRLEALRDRVVLAQGAEVFAGSIRDNLTVGRPVPGEVVNDVVRRVGLDRALRRLPQGFDTQLNGHGAPLTEGQVRRLVLARAMLQQPRLLLIDGLLDALPEAELVPLLQALDAPDAGWTTLVATRRPGVAQRFPRVVQLDRAPLRASEAAS